MDSVIYGWAKSPLELSEQWYTAFNWVQSKEYHAINFFGDLYTDTFHIQRDIWNAVSQACNEKAVLVVNSISRLTTSSQKAIKIIDMLSAAGASLACLEEELDTSTTYGAPILKIIHAFNEMNRISYDKRSRSIKEKKANGSHIGNLPFGWKIGSNGKDLVQNEKEMDIVKQIIVLRKAKFTYRYIAEHLMESGVLARRGTVWHPKVVMIFTIDLQRNKA